MVRLRCPRCALVKDAAVGTVPACGRCGFKSSVPVAAPPLRPATIRPAAIRPAVSVAPASKPVAGATLPLVQGRTAVGPVPVRQVKLTRKRPTPRPRQRRTGLVVAAVVVGMLLVAGAATAVYFANTGGDSAKTASRDEVESLTPEEVADLAAQRLVDDQGPDGLLSSQSARLAMAADDGSMEMDALMELTLYTDDAMLIEVTLETMSYNGQTMMAGVRVSLYCFPDRLVMKTSGFSKYGMPDANAETRNDAGACMEADERRIASSMGRLAATMDGPAGAMATGFASMGSSSEDTRRTLSAEAKGNDVEAKYRVTSEGQSIQVTSLIEDGRIVSETGEFPADGASIIATITYSYSPRVSPPAVHGAEQA